MASLQKTYSGDLSQSIALQLMSIVDDARGMASDAKKNAMDVAKAYGIDPMLRRGEFFGRALQTRATAGLPKRFQRQMPSVTMGNASYLARGQSIVDPLMGLGKDTKDPMKMRLLPEYQQFASSAERKFRGTAASTQALTKAAGERPTTNPITKNKGVKVEDEKLGSFIAAVALSLSSSIKSINEKMDENSEGIIVAKDGIASTYKQLEDNSDTVSDKLDSIIDALRHQNEIVKKSEDDREVSEKKEYQKDQREVSDAKRIQKSDATKSDIIMQQQLDAQESEGVISESPMIPDPWDTPSGGKEIPYAGEFANGGIASGPDSGYLAMLHGDEAIIALDNNWTQGQPSAVGKESPFGMPFLPRAERGMSAGGIKPGDNTSSTKPTMRRGGGSGKSSSSMFGGDKLAKAMELPAKAAGMVTMGLLGNVLKSVPLIGSVVSGIKLLSEPVAKMFGVPDQVGSGIAEDVANQQKQEAGRKEFTSRTRGKEGREKGILGKLKEFFFGEGGGTRVAHSSRVVHKGGSGGYGGGGDRIAWGKKAFNPSSKSEVPVIKRTTMIKDANSVQYDMLSPEAFEKKWNIPYETWRQLPMYPTDQSSNFFQTSASPMTAFNSPETNNTFANHINNESINDEVNQIINAGKVEPIVINQNAGSSENIDESQHSAIANSSSPFKEWMYTEPYA